MRTVPRTLAIDPGDVQSGWVVLDDNCMPVEFGLSRNEDLAELLPSLVHEHRIDFAAIEMIAAYGMAVGATVFTTCVWIGRFWELLEAALDVDVDLVFRAKVKLHHCGLTSAKDTNVKQAIVDRFAPGAPNHGKGRKDSPTIFYDFRADIWQAYALGVYAVDVLVPAREGAQSRGRWIPGGLATNDAAVGETYRQRVAALAAA